MQQACVPSLECNFQSRDDHVVVVAKKAGFLGFVECEGFRM
jgi:hypothetical protein